MGSPVAHVVHNDGWLEQISVNLQRGRRDEDRRRIHQW